MWRVTDQAISVDDIYCVCCHGCWCTRVCHQHVLQTTVCTSGMHQPLCGVGFAPQSRWVCEDTRGNLSGHFI